MLHDATRGDASEVQIADRCAGPIRCSAAHIRQRDVRSRARGHLGHAAAVADLDGRAGRRRDPDAVAIDVEEHVPGPTVADRELQTVDLPGVGSAGSSSSPSSRLFGCLYAPSEVGCGRQLRHPRLDPHRGRRRHRLRRQRACARPNPKPAQRITASTSASLSNAAVVMATPTGSRALEAPKRSSWSDVDPRRRLRRVHQGVAARRRARCSSSVP